MHPNIAHFDDVETTVIDRGPAAGTPLAPRRRGGPAHRAGLSRYCWARANGRCRSTCMPTRRRSSTCCPGRASAGRTATDLAVTAGDTIVHLAHAEAHAIVAGDDGLEVLAFGDGSPTGMTWLPRAQAWWMGPHWLPHDAGNPFRREAEEGPLDLPEPEPQRPPNIRGSRRSRRRGPSVPATPSAGGGSARSAARRPPA